ncbi:MAG: tetraacyldisaccharide 4'-kinase, partial [Flavobacteriales bacterium]
KCPDVLSPLERRIIVKKLDPLPHQHVYFSFICYDDIHPFFPNDYTQHPSKDYYFREHYSVLLVTGIANPTPLIYHIKPYVNEFLHIKFRDHHWYTSKDIQKIRKTFNKLGDEKKIILTTEKDIVRLQAGDLADEIRGLPLFYIPIRIDFHDSDINEFKKQVIDYVERTYRNI